MITRLVLEISTLISGKINFPFPLWIPLLIYAAIFVNIEPPGPDLLWVHFRLRCEPSLLESLPSQAILTILSRLKLFLATLQIPGVSSCAALLREGLCSDARWKIWALSRLDIYGYMVGRRGVESLPAPPAIPSLQLQPC